MYATTQQLINDVDLASRSGYIDLASRSGYIDPAEKYNLIMDLRHGLIIHPTWEDYGLQTESNGRPRPYLRNIFG